MIWTEECEKAFQELKRYLRSPPILSKPIPGEYLYLYLAISDSVISSVLIREESKVQKPVYYVSHTFLNVETRYLAIKKMALVLVLSARKLRPYFKAHTIVVLKYQTLRQLMQQPEVSGRLVQWAVELGEHDIRYRPKTIIKGQTIVEYQKVYIYQGENRYFTLLVSLTSPLLCI